MGTKVTNNTATSSSVQHTTIPKAGAQESGLRDFLISLSQKAGGQMGDLSSLANGTGLSLSDEDLALINKAVGGQADISRNALKSQFADQNAQMKNDLGATGQRDSSSELLRRLMVGGDQANALKDVELTRMASGAQYGMALPFQRGQMQLSANSQLLSQLGVASPILQSFLQERMAQGTTSTSGSSTGSTSTSGGSMGEMAPFLAAFLGGK
jgi:hypothetical protein